MRALALFAIAGMLRATGACCGAAAAAAAAGQPASLLASDELGFTSSGDQVII